MVETWLQKHYATQHYAASGVNWIFKEQGQVDLELHLLGDAIAAAFSNQCSQSGSFEPPSKHSADSAANKLVTSHTLVCLDFHMFPLPRAQPQFLEPR